MKHYRITIIAFCLLIAAQASTGQERKFGIGLMFGEPAGISAKYWMSPATALDFGLGWGVLGDDGSFRFHMDYLWHSFSAIKSSEQFPVYYGLGGRVNTDKNSFGVRGVIGVAWMSRDTPIDVFLEFVPVFDLTPDADFELEGGAGLRYYF